MKLLDLDITPKKEKQFNKKDIFSVEDLIRFLPRKYYDFTKITGILPETEMSCLIVVVKQINSGGFGKVKRITAVCEIYPTGEKIYITWFNQGFRIGAFQATIDRKVFVAGRVSYSEQYRNYQMVVPEIFEPKISSAMRIYPVYSKIKNMSAEYLEEKIKLASECSDATREIIPSSIVEELQLLPTRETLYQIHFPKTIKQLQKARERLIFDDLLYFATHQEWANRNSSPGSPFNIKTLGLVNKIRSDLPFELTADQDKTIMEMVKHVREGRRINALVQGDVGCGKTIVAILLMVAFVGSDYQAVLMAPTQVLARQHYDDLVKLVEPLGFEVAYLGSELKAAEKRAAMKRIASGEVQFIVGTHSVIGKQVKYKNLAIAITDEEHKFGVAQRAALIAKAAAGVHRITMSATPIPRSLAQVIYGETIQLYTISTMPSGRKPVVTGIARSREAIYKFLYSQVKQGHQAYIVCPMIDQNDDMEGVKSVEEVDNEYRQILEPYGIRIKTLTGKDTKEDTEETIAAFKRNEIDILISTTVIEVGVNVPNATAMVITNAERFGLSSLHQLRGRVGRSDLQSYCVLESENKTEKSQRRLKAMCETTNGFEIAKEDLAIRGAGDFLGTKQSGDNKYMSLMLAYPDRYKIAKEVANRILDDEKECLLVKRIKEEQEED